MDVVVERCAGLDVHRDDVVATVRVPGAGRRRWAQETRTFPATLAGLSALGGWVSEFVRPSFVPPPEIRRLRDLTRLRKAQSNERGRAILAMDLDAEPLTAVVQVG